MNVNIERLLSSLIAVGEIGKHSGGGITRLAFSDTYDKAVLELTSFMESAGLNVRVDSLGDVYGYRKGNNNKLPAIYIGSHLDTVIDGGLYDGNLGIHSGLEVVNMLNDANITTEHPIVIAAFNSEEANEFGGTFASRVATGRQDFSEKGLEEKLDTYNLSTTDMGNSVLNIKEIFAFLEMHIEQGPYLDIKNQDIGVVEGVVGIERYKIIIRGESNHAGTTPMEYRKDPMKIAGKVICKIYELAERYPHPFVTTVGNVETYPGMFNVITNEIVIFLDIRDLNQAVMDEYLADLREYLGTIDGFHIEMSTHIIKPPQLMNSTIKNIIEKNSNLNGYKTVRMSSGAGHDAKEMSCVLPTGMIFVPSIKGISHSPDEITTPEQIKKGVQVLYDTLLDIDKLETF